MTPRFAVLGPVEVRTGATALRIDRAQRRGMLAFLLLHADRTVLFASLDAALWGPAAPPSARSQIYASAHAIRRHLRGAGSRATLTASAGSYLLSLHGEELDLALFEEHVSRAHDDMAKLRWAPAADSLRAALDLWRGDALADASGAFVDAARSRLHDRRSLARSALVDCRLALGRPGEVLDDLRQQVEREPLNERSCAQLMLALHRDGRPTAALAEFQRLRSRLAAEQGIDPGPALVQVHRAILRGDELRSAPQPAGGTVVPAPRPAWQPPVPAQLPPRPAGFVGRDTELAALDRIAADPDGSRTALIVGGPGVGKTALATYWGHRHAVHTPDGQLVVDLHGFGPQEPLSAEVALERLLRGLGVPPLDLPGTLEERAALYRSTVAGRRCLVLLDNAHDTEQVRPLLAAGPGATLITSRRRLDGLVVHGAAAVLPLAALPPGPARTLLARAAGGDAGDADLDRLAGLCDHLPLALRIAAARLGGAPGLTVRELVDTLAVEQQRLDRLTVEGGTVAVAAAFRLSYRALPAPAALVFRRLGLHPGPVPSPAAAAALAGLAGPSGGPLLDELVATHLVRHLGADRYALHDLLRLYAAQAAATDDSAADRAAAESRLLEYYLVAAAAGEALLRPAATRVVPTLHGPAPQPVSFPDDGAALAWFDRESPNLVAALHRWGGRHPRACWQLAANMAGWLERRAARTTWVSVMRAASAAAGADGTPQGHATILNSLAIAHSHLRQYDAALAAFDRAGSLRESLGDRHGAALVAMNTGCTHIQRGDLAEAVRALRGALATFLELPDAAAAIGAVRLNLGLAYRSAGRWQEALALYRTVLAEAGDDNIACNAHTNIAALYRLTGEPAAALRHYRLARQLAERLGNLTYERWTRRGLGELYRDLGRHDEAVTQLELALALYRQADDPAVEEVRAELDELHRQRADGPPAPP